MDDTNSTQIKEDMLHITVEVTEEYNRATKGHAPFNTAHEGFAVLLEEVDELKAEVWKNKTKRDPEQMRREAVQVAAMAMRFIHDVCDTPGKVRIA